MGVEIIASDGPAGTGVEITSDAPGWAILGGLFGRPAEARVEVVQGAEPAEIEMEAG